MRSLSDRGWGTGYLEPHPGRLMLLYANATEFHVPYMAFSDPNDYFVWTRFGVAANSWRELHGRGDPGDRGGFSLLAEQGVDANPRAAFKTNTGPTTGNIMFWPYADGIRDENLYDHNDWQVIQHYVCESIVKHRCNEALSPGSCQNTGTNHRVLEVCGDFKHPVWTGTP